LAFSEGMAPKRKAKLVVDQPTVRESELGFERRAKDSGSRKC
jgi:hypothetical protein